MLLESIVSILSWFKIDLPWILSELVGTLRDNYNWMIIVLVLALVIILGMGAIAALDTLGIINV